MSDGRLKRAMAMMQPGMFLSHPGMEMLASYHCAQVTVSIESAIRSRDCSEYDIPSVPIEMPSLTPIVLNRIPTMPHSCTPSLTFSASLLRCMLQVFPSYQTLAIPTWALFMSASVSPVPYNIACEAPCERGCVMRELYLLRIVAGAAVVIPWSCSSKNWPVQRGKFQCGRLVGFRQPAPLGGRVSEIWPGSPFPPPPQARSHDLQPHRATALVANRVSLCQRPAVCTRSF